MANLELKLNVFEGPLDLLLHLIEKNKYNIFDIPIVTRILHGEKSKKTPKDSLPIGQIYLLSYKIISLSSFLLIFFLYKSVHGVCPML